MTPPTIAGTEPDDQKILRREMPELDSIRGLAILGVLFYHGLYEGRDLSPYSHFQRSFLRSMAPGQFGVALFFVLSGFLITGLLVDSKTRPDYYRRFYIRRALRILPAYYFILLFLAVTGLAAAPFLAISFVYCSNLAPLLGIAMAYPVLWSLAVEEHFYLVWPAVVHRISLKLLLATAVAIIVASPILRLLHFDYGVRHGSVWLGFDHLTWNAADGLALGAALAVILRLYSPSRRMLLCVSAALFAVAGLSLVIGSPHGIATRGSAVGATFLWTIWSFASAGLLILFLLIGTSSWKSLVRPRILLFFGEISYGLYLIHLLVFWGYDRFASHYAPGFDSNFSAWKGLWFRFIVASLVAVGVSFLSRRYFENPFLRLKDKFTH
jgi:peptidoglycan/LPS O-acetylase OafA/YrhL